MAERTRAIEKKMETLKLKVGMLEALAEKLATQGPLRALKTQTLHYDFMFSSLLADRTPFAEDGGARKLRKILLYANLLGRLINTCNLETHRLEAVPSDFRRGKRAKRSDRRTLRNLQSLDINI